tara:strand:- start:1451 stop:1576 length:126 start_codon:yes stop_codon:yes gene_type:complete
VYERPLEIKLTACKGKKKAAKKQYPSKTNVKGMATILEKHK